MNCAKWKLAVILTWLLPSEKKGWATTSAQEVLKRLLKRYKSVCLSVGVAKLLISLVTLGLCVAQKSSTSSSQKLLFILQHLPWAELPKWYFYREREKEGKGRVGGEKRSVREKARKIWQQGRRKETERGEREGRRCQVCVVPLLFVSTLESEFRRYHKTHQRNASFNNVNPFSHQMSHTWKHIHTHTHKDFFK